MRRSGKELWLEAAKECEPEAGIKLSREEKRLTQLVRVLDHFTSSPKGQAAMRLLRSLDHTILLAAAESSIADGEVKEVEIDSYSLSKDGFVKGSIVMREGQVVAWMPFKPVSTADLAEVLLQKGYAWHKVLPTIVISQLDGLARDVLADKRSGLQMIPESPRRRLNF